MDFNEYQDLTRETAIYRTSIEKIAAPGTKAYDCLCLMYVGLGLGEAGEIQGKIKKIIRDSGGILTPEAKVAIKKEIGDQMWYLSQTANECGISLDECAQGNIEKLFDRRDRGVLQGSGDDR